MESIQRWFAKQRLVRSDQDTILGGVCAGIGRTTGMNAWTVRFLFILAMLVVPGSQVLIYPILWVAMPDERRAAELTGTGTQIPS